MYSGLVHPFILTDETVKGEIMDIHELDASLPPFYATDAFLPTVAAVIVILALITAGAVFFIKKAQKNNSRDDENDDREDKR